MCCYSIYSKSLEFYNQPFFMSDHDTAVYNVRNLINSGDPVLLRNIDDLELRYIGFFNSKLGFTSSVVHPIIDLKDIPGLNLAPLPDITKEEKEEAE